MLVFLMGGITSLSATGAALVYPWSCPSWRRRYVRHYAIFENNAMAMLEWSRYATYGLYDIGAEIIGTERHDQDWAREGVFCGSTIRKAMYNLCLMYLRMLMQLK